MSKSQWTRKPLFVDREILESPAWRKMPGTAGKVYLWFLMRRQVEKTKDPHARQARFRTANDGEIVFTYREAKKRFGLSSPRFHRALADTVRYGFLDMAHHGTGLKGDATKWGFSDRWRAYGKPDFKVVELPKGRKWTVPKITEAAHENVRAPAHENVR